ncbi:MAG: amidohydrolase [Anaerolinea sp.]
MIRVLYHAQVYSSPYVKAGTAIAIQDDRVLAVGSDEDLLLLYGKTALCEDMQGACIFPGLTDAHLHLEQYALSLQRVDCETQTLQECLQRVKARIEKTPPGKWVRGHGWNQNLWSEGFGNNTLLDAVSPQNPVYLTAKSLHAAWANSQALVLAGIDKTTSDPPGGKIQRDPQGRPTGILFESAMQLVERVLPAPTPQEVAEAIQEAQKNLLKMGITSVHDFDQSRCFSALQILDQSNNLKIRVLKSIPLENLPDAIRLGLRSGFGSSYLRIGSVKLFADGALGPHTAAMFQPYENEPQNTGILFLDHEDVVEYGREAVQHGLSLAIHAIGDRANHEVLLGLAQVRAFEKEQKILPLRHRIEHVQCLNIEDFPLFDRHQILASVQPVHAISDMEMADTYWGTRSQTSYAYKSLQDYGAKLVFGSDAPVESPNPWLGVYAAVTRRKLNGFPGIEGWHPEQRISVQDALAGFTISPAFAAVREQELGKLEKGFLADLIVLPESPLEIPPDKLPSLLPVATMVGGEWVWWS